jgi:hypothetical protein
MLARREPIVRNVDLVHSADPVHAPASSPAPNDLGEVARSIAASSFSQASDLVVAYLKKAIPLGYWAVTRVDGESQILLSVQDDNFGLVRGDSHAWSHTMCRHMVRGEAPQIAPNAQVVPALAPVSKDLNIGTYIGLPIRLEDGTLFGTLCGLDQATHEAQ